MAIAELPALEQFDELRATYRAFLEEHVYPAEAALNREDGAAEELMASLRSRAKAEGLWAPHLPPEAGGTGQALRTLRDQPYGPWLLSLVAAGLILFGIFSFVEARFRRIRVGN